MRSILRLALLFLLLLITVRRVSSKSTVPFIYYYSHSESAFFIESADGVWRRPFIPYQVPQDHFGVLGPGWSTSGRWFTWFSYKLYGEFDMVNKIHIVSRTGDRMKVFGSLGGIVSVKWSPVEDLLYFEETGGYGPRKAYIYDPQHDEKIELQHPLEAQYILSLEWSPDSNYIMRAYVHDGQTHLQVFTKGGALIMDRQVYIAGDEGFTWDSYTPYRCIVPRWTPHSDLIYMSDPDELIIEELSTGLQQKYPFTGGNLGWVDWSPDGNYAIIFKVRECLGSSIDLSEVWWLSRPDRRTMYLSNVSVTPSITGHPDLFSFISKELWTNDSQRFAYVDSSGNVMVVQVPSLETDLILSVPDENQPTYQTYELFWSSNEDLFWFDRYWNLNHYNINSGLESTQLGTYSSGYHVRFSPDFEHMAVYDQSCGHTCVVSLNEEPKIILEFGSADNRNLEGTYYWYKNSKWLVVITQNSGIFIADIENRTFKKARFADFFHYAPSQFGWLPDVVE